MLADWFEETFEFQVLHLYGQCTGSFRPRHDRTLRRLVTDDHNARRTLPSRRMGAHWFDTPCRARLPFIIIALAFGLKLLRLLALRVGLYIWVRPF